MILCNYFQINNEVFPYVRGFSHKGFHLNLGVFFLFSYFIVVPLILIYTLRMLAKRLICLTGIDNNIILVRHVWRNFLLLYPLYFSTMFLLIS